MASPDSHSRVSSEHDDDRHAPAPLSTLYQYHNAPEVAPAHGLEHDDTTYPVSDKFPVIHETKFGSNGHYTGKHAYLDDNKPPRIIFGMKVKTFLLVAIVMVLILVGAAVGGAVGGRNLHSGEPPSGTYNDMQATKPTSTTTTSTTSTFSAPTPTYTPLSNCPSANNQTYTSQYAQSSSSDSTTTNLSFHLHCNLQNPLTTKLTQAYVYTFPDCAEVCASYNLLHGDGNCTLAVYKPSSPRPANCWVGSSDSDDEGSTAEALHSEDGTEVAILFHST